MGKVKLLKEPDRAPINPAEGPWLIRSHYWGRWHCRSDDGGACGYTDDISRAGVFDFEKAKAYHEVDPMGRDEAIPAARAIASMEERLSALTEVRDTFAEKVASLRQALQGPANG